MGRIIKMIKNNANTDKSNPNDKSNKNGANDKNKKVVN